MRMLSKDGVMNITFVKSTLTYRISVNLSRRKYENGDSHDPSEALGNWVDHARRGGPADHAETASGWGRGRHNRQAHVPSGRNHGYNRSRLSACPRYQPHCPEAGQSD